MSVQVEPLGKGLYIKVSGRMDKTTFREMNRSAWEHPAWDSAWFTIVDMSEVDEVEVSEIDLVMQSGMANAGARSGIRSKAASVATNPDAIRIFRMWQRGVKEELFETQLFDNLDDAREWCATARPRPQVRT